MFSKWVNIDSSNNQFELVFKRNSLYKGSFHRKHFISALVNRNRMVRNSNA